MSATIVTILVAVLSFLGAITTAYFSYKSGKAKELEKENEGLKKTIDNVKKSQNSISNLSYAKRKWLRDKYKYK